MTYAEAALPEFDQEMASTRKVLERVPEDKLDWRPHAKSNTIGWNANHLAELPGWAGFILTRAQFDYAPVGGPPYEAPNLRTRRELLDRFDSNVASARKALAVSKDDDMKQMWSLLAGGKPIFTLPRSAVMRSMVINHIIHHRAILCVYLRMNDVPVPGMYGPSGDE
jgi:uncharacterized damage-inducible protein DinB